MKIRLWPSGARPPSRLRLLGVRLVPRCEPSFATRSGPGSQASITSTVARRVRSWPRSRVSHEHGRCDPSQWGGPVITQPRRSASISSLRRRVLRGTQYIITAAHAVSGSRRIGPPAAMKHKNFPWRVDTRCDRPRNLLRDCGRRVRARRYPHRLRQQQLCHDDALLDAAILLYGYVVLIETAAPRSAQQ